METMTETATQATPATQSTNQPSQPSSQPTNQPANRPTNNNNSHSVQMKSNYTGNNKIKLILVFCRRHHIQRKYHIEHNENETRNVGHFLFIINNLHISYTWIRLI